jgi:hypothetical protein
MWAQDVERQALKSQTAKTTPSSSNWQHVQAGVQLPSYLL